MESENKTSPALTFLFWLFWMTGIALLLWYLFSLVVGIGMLQNVNQLQGYLAPLPGLFAAMAQGWILWRSYKMFYHEQYSNAQLYLLLIGGSLLTGFLWFGGCLLTLSGARIAG